MLTKQRLVMRAAGLSIWLLVPAILVGLIVSALYIAAAICNALLFTELLGARYMPKMVGLIAAIVVLLLVRPLFEVCGQLLQNRAGLVVKSKLRQALLAELEARGPMRAGLGRSGQIQSVLSDGVEAIEPYFIKYFTQLAVTVVTAVVLTFVIATISPLIAGILLVCGVAIIAIPRLWDKALASRGRSHWIAYENLNADFVDAMMGMSTLKSFGAAQNHGQKLERQSRQLLSSTMGQLRLSLGETGLSGMMKVLGPALGLVVAFALIRAGSMPLYSLFLITLLSIELFRPFTALSSCWHEAFFGISALPAMSALFERTACAPAGAESAAVLAKMTDPARAGESAVPPTAVQRSQIEDLPQSSTVAFINASYTYLGATEPALKEVNFAAFAGKTTALVGLSGSGKSTALGLLMGFDRPSSGTVMIGGILAANLDIAQTVTLVPQDPIIFPGTVRSILAEANPHADAADMMKVLTLTCATNLHRENSATLAEDSVLDLNITENARNLSGGQKQRLAIARALIRQCPLLVLDESTSALDTQTETLVLSNIRQAYPDLTLIFVTHRIDTAAQADQVVVMGSGQVLCAGEPRLLAKGNNAWAELIAAQLGVQQ
ncbi:ABC transporter ATP-binding protein/permease [uncultured Arcanobacterium sp.]|uniref:ABC transporter ATP-binding protein/permease n=1 Tax=uncultured Arcanobacterium sp. TaxID=487520 RepID=UPI00261C2E50|nr:ATP-binding cassette domain-containing protein [uncultured Arcanobacterium sp.]